MLKTTKIAIAVGAVLLVGAAGIATHTAAEARDGYGRDSGRHHGHFTRASHHARGLAMLMERFDANQDEKLTQEELDQSRKDLLAKHDANADGKLTLAEFEQLWLDVMRKSMVRGFQRIDEDGSAEITAEEFLKPYGKVVKRLDRNEDGVLDAEDRRARHWKRDRDGDRRGDRDRG